MIDERMFEVINTLILRLGKSATEHIEQYLMKNNPLRGLEIIHKTGQEADRGEQASS